MHQQSGFARVQNEISLLSTIGTDQCRRIVRSIVHFDKVKWAAVRHFVNGNDEQFEHIENMMNLLGSTVEQIKIAKLQPYTLAGFTVELICARHIFWIGTWIRGRYKNIGFIFLRRYLVRTTATATADGSSDFKHR